MKSSGGQSRSGAPGGSPSRSRSRFAMSAARSARNFGLSPGRERKTRSASRSKPPMRSRPSIAGPASGVRRMTGGGATAAASETIARSRTTIVPAPRSPRRRVCGWKNMTTMPIRTTRTSTMRMTLRTASGAEVGCRTVEPDHPQSHGALAGSLAAGHHLGDEEIAEVDETGEEPCAGSRRSPRRRRR